MALEINIDFNLINTSLFLMNQHHGVIAAGHELTVQAAETILQNGGNAFDAVIAAHLAACVAEPVLSSLGGGGYLMAQQTSGHCLLYDFFVQTPLSKRAPEQSNFFPINADFGTVQQEFNIGWASIATPGTVKGLFSIHKDLATMPMTELAKPAIDLARNGTEINSFQAYIFEIIQAIYSFNPDTRRIYSSPTQPDKLLQPHDLFRQPELADSLECLALEGEGWFYRGDIAQTVSKLCRENGGHLDYQDFINYQVVKHQPLSIKYRNAQILTNPAPSAGGTLIAFALKLLETFSLQQHNAADPVYLDLLAQVQAMTNKVRVDTILRQNRDDSHHTVLDPAYIQQYKAQIINRPLCSRGTTHMSIIDKQSNIASLTTSNGEGCGYVIPGTGILLNNMLGEQDLNPQGFHQWPTDQRMTSMMAPSIAYLADGTRIATGSGGSNRIRTAILQVLINLIDFDMPLEAAISSPRINYENAMLNIEGGLDPEFIKPLLSAYPQYKLWESRNLFFGGAHSVSLGPKGFVGIGDPRRGGFGQVVEGSSE